MPDAPDAEELRRLTRLLQELAADRSLLYQITREERVALLSSAGKVANPSPIEKKKRAREHRVELRRAKNLADNQDVAREVQAAIDNTNTWLAAHQKVRDLDNSGDYLGAVDLAIGSKPESGATAFAKLDDNLLKALAKKQPRLSDLLDEPRCISRRVDAGSVHPRVHLHVDRDRRTVGSLGEPRQAIVGVERRREP